MKTTKFDLIRHTQAAYQELLRVLAKEALEEILHKLVFAADGWSSKPANGPNYVIDQVEWWQGEGPSGYLKVRSSSVYFKNGLVHGDEGYLKEGSTEEESDACFESVKEFDRESTQVRRALEYGVMGDVLRALFGTNVTVRATRDTIYGKVQYAVKKDGEEEVTVIK